MSKEFIQTMEESVIPSVHRMIKKEKKHIEFLKKNINNVDVSEFLETSKKMLKHYKQRLKEYQDYVEKLKRES